ncbi:hypothetical protein ULF88_22015 [Halopseudomonas pachastrellae]|nr:hypothetical protein [Halopseudomonas pachastrellae]
MLTDFWPGDEDFDKLEQEQAQLGYEFEHRFNETFSVQQNVRYGHTAPPISTPAPACNRAVPRYWIALRTACTSK